MPIHGYPGGVITANPVAPTSTVATGVWTTEQQLQATSAGNWPRPGPPQPISRSLRFNSADTAYLNRTFSSGNRKTWTWSAWVKRSGLGTEQFLFANYNATVGGAAAIRFEPDNTLLFYNFVGAFQVQRATSQVFRDTSAWYHIVAVLDTTQATAANRAKLYINGVQVTAFSATTDPTQNYDGVINYNDQHEIGTMFVSSASSLFNGYLTEVNFVDGQALTPSSFGQTNASTGVWEPIPYTGTYGTNGFYLNFSDNSGTTSTTLGKDYSGNGNNWTPNNFSVTAGAGNDSLVDSPTSYGTDTGVGGEVRGNYCTLNPLDVSANTLSNGNLDITYATNSDTNRGGTIAVSTGKWYFEATVQAVGGTYAIIGVTSGVATATSLGSAAYQYSYISSTGNKFNNGSSTAYGNTYTTGDVIGVALDMDNGKVWFSKNGTFQASGDPAAGTNQAFSGLSGSFSPAINARNNSIVNLNCGQRAFAYTAPSGFKALCTTNLPTPTIGATSTTQANDYFDAITRNGFGSSGGSVATNFQADLIWEKPRNAAYSHYIVDSVRGITSGTAPFLSSNTTSQEQNANWFNAPTASTISFNSNDWGTSTTLVDWIWKANGAGSSNTAGTITSTVSANTTSGFSIVTYTGTGSNATVGHGIGTAPQMVICKNRSVSAEWYVYHASLGTNKAIFLEQTAAASTSNLWWNNTAPTSTVFSLGDQTGNNGSGNSIVAYCFAPVAGYSAFGSYTGNASTDGPFVYLGFRPRWIMFKRSDGVSAWELVDTARSTYNVMGNVLFPNYSNAEATTGDYANLCDALSNGFKIRSTSSASNSGTVIYAAFAEFPFKYSLAR
jgi:hypothetical protein